MKKIAVIDMTRSVFRFINENPNVEFYLFTELEEPDIPDNCTFLKGGWVEFDNFVSEKGVGFFDAVWWEY